MMINKNKNFQMVFEYFNSLVDEMRCLKEDPDNCYAGQTSDSLYFYTNQLTYLTEFINVFLHFNLYSMSKNVFFRGGIARGKLQYNRPYQFFGDCVINSYLLEESISKYPRITIDRKTIDDFKKIGFPDWEFDADKHRHYLNPFSKIVMNDISQYLISPSTKLQEIDVELIKKIRKSINDNINNSEFSDSVYEKYWYLMDRCDKLLETLKNTK